MIRDFVNRRAMSGIRTEQGSNQVSCFLRYWVLSGEIVNVVLYISSLEKEKLEILVDYFNVLGLEGRLSHQKCIPNVSSREYGQTL